MSGGSNNLSWEARGALVKAGVVPAGVKCTRRTDENHADEFWFCRVPMTSRLRNIDGM
jgi:hypothetical protein